MSDQLFSGLKLTSADAMMTPRQKEVLRVFRECGCNGAKAAKRLGLTPGGVRQTVKQCRRKIDYSAD